MRFVLDGWAMVRRWLLIVLTTLTLPATFAEEVQSHGLMFEKWLRDTFFRGYVPKGYTQKWDIPAEANPDHGGIPVNPKAAKFGTPVDLGDALRQYEIVEKKERFLLIVGFWKQVSKEQKRWVNVQAVTVEPELWARLWGPVKRADLERLVAVIKDPELSIAEARTRVKALKSKPPFIDAILQVNPKIDASQRRLQCSLRFDDFFKYLAPDARAGEDPEPKAFGIPIPQDFASRARQTK